MYQEPKYVELDNPKETMPIAYEVTNFAKRKWLQPIIRLFFFQMMVNIPIKYADKSEASGEESRGQDFIVSKTGDYHYFNRKAFGAFMAINHFDFFIRSHNPCEEGYALCFTNRCLTVFSCRKVAKTTLPNTCVAFLSDSKRNIRFVRFNTKDGERSTSSAQKTSRRPLDAQPNSNKAK